MIDRFGNWIDNLGVLTAWICVAHCLFMPLLLGIIPLLGLSFLLTETAEKSLIGISFLIALFSLLPSYLKQHRKLRSISLAIAGLSLIIATHLLFEDNLFLKAILLFIGATLITSAHLLNRYLCRTCNSCQK